MDKLSTYAHLERTIQETFKKHNLDRPFLIAIDGLGGAGKTTLAQQLKSVANRVVVIHMDDHIVDRRKRYDTGHEQWFEYYQLQWDAPFLRKNLFETLHRNDSQLCLSFYNKKEDRLEEKEMDIEPKSIVIIEGVFLLREEWKAFYDLIIYLDCPMELRYQRVLHRDTYIGDVEERLKKYENRYWPAEHYYLEKQKPLEVAHFICDIEAIDLL